MTNTTSPSDSLCMPTALDLYNTPTILGIPGDLDTGIVCIIRTEMDDRRYYVGRACDVGVDERHSARRSALYFLLALGHDDIDRMLDELWDYTDQWANRSDRTLVEAIAAWRSQREVDSQRDEAEGRVTTEPPEDIMDERFDRHEPGGRS